MAFLLDVNTQKSFLSPEIRAGYRRSWPGWDSGILIACRVEGIDTKTFVQDRRAGHVDAAIRAKP